MTNKKCFFGIPVMVLVFGIAILGACGSAPTTLTVMEPIMPDNENAVIYVLGNRYTGHVWDGETPIGDFSGIGRAPGMVAWKTAPGRHILMAKAYNWAAMRVDIEPNRRYFFQLQSIPNPIPFSRSLFVAIKEINELAGEEWLKQRKIFSFDDEWRAGHQAKWINDARIQIEDAQKRDG